MSDLTNTFSDIANAIRYKEGSVNTYTPLEMAGAINNIVSGWTLSVTQSNIYQDFRTSFNSPVEFSSSVLDYEDMFNGFVSFNQHINNINCFSAENMFRDCYNFNQKININLVDNGPSLPSASNIFRNCYNFNSSVNMFTFVNNTSVSYAFANCTNFNIPLKFGAKFKNFQHLLDGAINFGQTVNFTSTRTNITAQTDVLGMFANTGTGDSAKRKYIYFNNRVIDTDIFLGNSPGNSLVADYITWTSTGTGQWENDYYNIVIRSL